MPDQLPKGWVKTTLGEVCARVATIQPEDSPDTEFTYFDIGGIDNQSNRIVETKPVIGRDAPSRARQSVRKDDILFSTVRTYLKKIARIERDYANPVASTGFTVIRAAAGVSPQFLFSQILSEDFLQPIHALQSGSSYPAVRDKDVFAQPIRLAPAREQERIVAKLDALLSRVAAGQVAARRALDRLQRYRAAVLHAAVTGELTRAWRKQQSAILNPQSPIESGEALLRRLLAERRARWEATELKRLQAAGKPPKDNKWKARYRAPFEADTTDLPGLPKGWAWASVDQMAAHEPRAITDGPFGSQLKSSHYTNSGPRVIRLQNIGDGVFVDEMAHISRKHYEFLKDHAIYAGDLVIRALGIPAPRACKIPDGIGPAIVKADCIRLKVASDFAAADYVLHTLNAPSTQHRTEKKIHGVGRPRLNLGEIKSIAIPFPPLAEQSEIVREVERRLAAVDRLTCTLNRQLDRARATRQSLLREAFAGKLVPQDPQDEPASALLDRIRAAREAESKKPKEKRMPKPKLKIVRSPLLDVLRSHKKPISPEQLFRESGFQKEFEANEYRQDVVDKFYQELRAITGPRGPVTERRPNSNTVLLEVQS